MPKRQISRGVLAGGLAGLALLALAMRIYAIGVPSLWLDESFTAAYSGFGLDFLWGRGFWLETNPPLYYTIMHVVIGMFGSSEAVLRAPSALASAGAVVVVGLIGTRMAGRAAGLIAALLYAVVPGGLYYGQDARVYEMMCLADGVVLLAVARLVEPAGEPRRRDLALYAIAAVVTVYLHATGVFFLAAIVLCVTPWLGLLAWRARPSVAGLIRDRRLIGWSIATLLVAALALPEVLAMAHQAGSANISWIKKFAPWQLRAATTVLITGGSEDGSVLRAVVGPLIFVLLLTICFMRRAWRPAVIIVSVAIPIIWLVMVCTVSLFRPFFLTRMAIWLLVPYCALCATILVERRLLVLRLGLAGLLAVAAGANFYAYYPVQSYEGWRALAAALQAREETLDLVGFATGLTPIPVDYYFPAQRDAHNEMVDDSAVWSRAAEPTVMRLQAAFPRRSVASFVRAIDSGRRVWLVTRGDDVVLTQILKDAPAPSFREVYRGGVMLFGW